MPLGRDLERAVALLQAGELVAFPTETVYGLGADASNPQAVAKIFAAKERPADHPLIVHLPGADVLAHWACEIPDAAYRLAAAFWPGPLTLILKRHERVPQEVTGGQETIGLRVPDHRLALALLRAFDEAEGGRGAGIAAPSANRFGRISPTQAAHVREELGARVALILDGGPCAVGIESTIVDLSAGTPRILRPGALSAAALAQVLGQPVMVASGSAASQVASPRVSGSLAAHYAPRIPLRLVAGAALIETLQQVARDGRRCFVLAHGVPLPASLPAGASWQGMAPDAAGYAHDLYTRLRQADQGSFDLILVEQVSATDETWRAVADRLARAACGSGNAEQERDAGSS